MMFDSDVIADLPRAALCATYSDLIPDAATLARLRAEFPHGLVLIDRHGDPTGQATVLDVETSLHTPDQAPGWFDGKQREGIVGTIYANRSTMPAVNAAMGARRFFRWIARLDGILFVEGFHPGQAPAAVQFASAKMLGFHCDASVVWEAAWHPAPKSDRWPGARQLVTQLAAVDSSLRSAISAMKGHID